MNPSDQNAFGHRPERAEPGADEGRPSGGRCDASPRTTVPRSADPAQRDRAWAGYSPRAAAPALAAAAAASALVWTGRWYLDGPSELANAAGAPAVFALAWGVWPALAAVYLYRAVTYTYRLTDRAVLVDFGFRHRPVAPVPLAAVTAVGAGAGRLGARLGVGWVEVRTADRVVRLVGVRRPAVLAEAIRAACKMRNPAAAPATTENRPPPPAAV